MYTPFPRTIVAFTEFASSVFLPGFGTIWTYKNPIIPAWLMYSQKPAGGQFTISANSQRAAV